MDGSPASGSRESTPPTKIETSVVLPFYNEQGNAGPLLQELLALNPAWEILAVDDGSTDETSAEIAAVPGVHLLRHARNFGQSAALWTGLQKARGTLIVMMDGDGQNNPEDLPRLLAQAERGVLVCGVRVGRTDGWWRNGCGRMANWWRNLILRDGLEDAGCTLKVIHRDDVRHLVYFDGFHRFFGPLARSAGWTIRQIPVGHRRRQNGHSHYTARSRLWRGLLDLAGVFWLLQRRRNYHKFKTDD